jgi:multicomponent K+:H+ antiporter subunit E
VLLGGAAAVLAGLAMAALRPERLMIRRLPPLLKLAGIVLVDIVRSNFAVAAIVLFARRERVSGFVRLHIDLTNRYGLTLLALILTATPGTIWVEFDSRRGSLLVHVLDLVDEDAWVRLIKDRYETLLLEIFER